MGKLLQYLNQPYPKMRDKRWVSILWCSLIVFGILISFQPFGIANIEKFKILYVAGYGLITAVCMYFMLYIVPVVGKRLFISWTILKEIIFQILLIILICIGNCLFSIWSYGSVNAPVWKIMSVWLQITCMVGIVPITLLVILHHNRLLKKNLTEAQLLNETLQSKTKIEPSETGETKIILDSQTKDQLRVEPDNILYLEASGNYVKVFYLLGGEVRSKMLRTTIKQMQDKLADIPYIIRCHRAFLVNLNRIKSVSGNSQGCHLSLYYTQEEIPVSRAYTKSLREIRI